MDSLLTGMFIRPDILKKHGNLIINENLNRDYSKSTERQVFEKELEKKLLRGGKNAN